MTHRWTQDECRQVQEYVQRHGMQWEDLQTTYFPQLSQSQVKQKYYDLSRKATGKYASSQDLKRFIVCEDMPKKLHIRSENLMSTLIRLLTVD
ncbi:Myb-like DNA-binding domain-containing protein [Spironucleus salmonicida]|uniref:Myb-like DNA-binding domain-containing protein n=1 Tax=Spironucleus salmonicida TaxID=348837 RepID=V6LWF2_9EUKA|nr:Myb-like DNA-binding domain-containing protein [Spironucleus salmonicida]|eukprot:EST48895.1 Myb-like DNA-binding domain-containing protein [Spironucleus salmonicida]